MDKSDRDTDIWLREKRLTSNSTGPGCYNSKVLSQKESFNFVKIPFGTGIDRFKLKGGALEVGNLYSPGPCSY